MDIFKDKVVIITGGASGIGRSLGGQLARRGAIVTLADRNAALLAETADTITKQGYKVKSAPLDVTDVAAVKSLIDDTYNEHGRLDYLFNNAGIGVGGEARDFSYEDWRKVIDTNLYGVVHGVFAAYPIMVKQGFGHIVNTSSMAGIVPFPDEISYVASKYAIVGLSHVLRAEAADLGVRVTVVCPGKIETPIYDTGKLVNIDREKAMALLPPGVTADECARIIIKGVERNKATVVVTGAAKFFWYLHRLSHTLSFLVARYFVRKIRTLRIKD